MRKSVFFNNQIDGIKNLAKVVEEIGDELNMNSGEIFNFNLILEEALTNIIFYGYDQNTQDKIELVVTHDKDSLSVEIIDSAKPFDITKQKQGAHSGLTEETQVGGLGILLIKKLSKSIDYKRENGKNHLIIKI